MVAMTFVGAAVVSRRNMHLRMDVLLDLMSQPVRLLLRLIELLLLIVLSGFVLAQSALYAQRMFSIGRTSDMAGVPMWIPHGMVTLGFGLLLIVSLWRLVSAAWLARGNPKARSPGFDLRACRRTDCTIAARFSDLHGPLDRRDRRDGLLHECTTRGPAAVPLRLG